MSISASPGRLSCGSSLLAGGPLCIILGALCFSTTGTVQALAPDGSHPLGIGALRMQIGALALWAWCACRHSLPAGLRHWQLRWLIPATLGLLGFQVFFFWGVQQAGVAVGTVTAIGFSPVMAAILARIILGERPARIWYPATGLALVEPLGAVCWGIFLLHEPVGGQELAGMGLLFGGVALLALGKKTENTPPTEDHASSRPLSGEGAPQH